jgi:hypothetical protein
MPNHVLITAAIATKHINVLDTLIQVLPPEIPMLNLPVVPERKTAQAVHTINKIS